MKSLAGATAVPEASICHQLPIRGGYSIAQVIMPRNMTREEADRLCAFVRSLVTPDHIESRPHGL